MQIVIACDSFKGTLTSFEAGQAIADGIRRACPHADVDVMAVADGGEGTVDAVRRALGGRLRSVRVTGPLGDPVDAGYLVTNDAETGRTIAVLEMASASGLTLLTPDRYDPMRATTFGAGRLLLEAIGCQPDDILVAVGGSATVDGGCGAAQALGVCFLDSAGQQISTPIGGGRLASIHNIDASGLAAAIRRCNISVLCDVTNPLCGPEGAAPVFGPQKGADAGQVRLLADGLAHLADVIKKDLGIDVATMAGGGAAGGLGAGLAAFAGAKLVRGADAILDLVNFDARVTGADLIVTGEGKLDRQSTMGKLVGVVAERARKRNIPAIAITGCISQGADAPAHMLDEVYAVSESPPARLPAPTEAVAQLKRRTSEAITKWLVGRQ